MLAEIFRQVDLDGNGALSRTEFNLFNWRTSGEEVQVCEMSHGVKRLLKAGAMAVSKMPPGISDTL